MSDCSPNPEIPIPSGATAVKFSVRYAGLFSERKQSKTSDSNTEFSVRYAGLFSEPELLPRPKGSSLTIV